MTVTSRTTYHMGRGRSKGKGGVLRGSSRRVVGNGADSPGSTKLASRSTLVLLLMGFLRGRESSPPLRVTMRGHLKRVRKRVEVSSLGFLPSATTLGSSGVTSPTETGHSTIRWGRSCSQGNGETEYQ